MATPLSKKNKDGIPYARPTEVEANIDGAVEQSTDTLRRRLQLTRNDSDYIKSECVVHLLRRACDRDDEERIGVLHMALMKRVGNVLRRKISDSHPDAVEARLEAMCQLNILIARQDASLDFYEVNFDLAFKNIYLKVAGLTRGKANRRPLLINDVGGAADTGSTKALCETQFAYDLDAALAQLSPVDIEAFSLVEIMGYDIESSAPGVTTAATLCRVSGRTIRTRLRRAKDALAKLLEVYKP